MTDYKALVGEARATVAEDYREFPIASQGYRRRIALLRLADAVEALVAEREQSDAVMLSIIDATSGPGEGPSEAEMVVGVAEALSMAAVESARAKWAALVAERDQARKAATAAVRRLEKAAQLCGDPQHPRWDVGSTKTRQRLADLLEVLDPFRPGLEDARDEDWDRVYKLDPIDSYVSDYEERVTSERDEAVRQLSESRARYADMEARVVELEAVIHAITQLGVGMIVETENGYWDKLDGILAAPSLVLGDYDTAVRKETFRDIEDALIGSVSTVEDWRAPTEEIGSHYSSVRDGLLMALDTVRDLRVADQNGDK